MKQNLIQRYFFKEQKGGFSLLHVKSYTKSLEFKTAQFWSNRLREQGDLVENIETEAFIWKLSIYQFGKNKSFRK